MQPHQVAYLCTKNVNESITKDCIDDHSAVMFARLGIVEPLSGYLLFGYTYTNNDSISYLNCHGYPIGFEFCVVV